MFFSFLPYSKAALSALSRWIADFALCAAFLLAYLPAVSAQEESGEVPVRNTLFGLTWFVLVTAWLLIMCSRMIRQRRPKRPRYLRRRINRSRPR